MFLSELHSLFKEREFLGATLSNARQKGIEKITVRPLTLKGEAICQISQIKDKQAFHRNLSYEATWELLKKELQENYKQALLQFRSADYQVLINKKNEPTVLKKAATKTNSLQVHNEQKKYLLPENVPNPFLHALDIMDEKGRVLPKKRDKFKQINRYLEFIDDVLAHLTDSTINVIDFGCGKAYLTFALYHYLKDLGKNVIVEGLDLKQTVVQECQQLADRLGFDGLHFGVGDIKGYQPKGRVDLVVSLHACDTATDAALVQAIKWNAKVILAVPCCQHELNKQVEHSDLEPILRHGILRERFAALATDAARVEFLEAAGYKTQIMEFIDMEHTPKNLLIRAVKGKVNKEAAVRLENFKKALDFSMKQL